MAGSDGHSAPGEASPAGVLSAVRSAMAGPIAGICSRLVTYPADTVKARLQVQGAAAAGGPAPYTGTLNALAQVARLEGLRGFYRGFGAVALGSVPANLAYFGGYEAAKGVVPAGWGMGGDMVVGAGAQLVAGVVFTPIDIVKERMQVAPLMRGAYSYSGPWEAIQQLVLQRGPLGLLKGYWATNAVWIPWNALFIAFYESSKRAALAAAGGGGAAGAGVGRAGGGAEEASSSGRDETEAAGAQAQAEAQLSPWVLGLCSAGSASLAGLLTHPADVVKTRLQVLSACEAHARTTAWTLAREMWAREGAAVFMTGLGARLLQLAPGTALSWVVYEPVKRFLAPR